MPDHVCVIVNPAAGRGRGARALQGVTEAFGAVGITTIHTSKTKGDEGELARKAIDAGATTLVAVGGDGTWSNVANAVLAAGAGDQVRLALVAAGTGNDFAKTTGAPASDAAATAKLVMEGVETRVDVGRIEDHYFLNITGFGFDIAVLEDIPSIPYLKGDAVYIFSALRQLVGYRGVEIDVASPLKRRGPVRHLMLVIANAKNFGGAFHIAPDASLTDGALDAISIHDASAWRRLKLFGSATKGTHLAYDEVVAEQAASFIVRFPEPPAYETDGEYRRAASAELEVTCVPKALRVVARP
ncbi:MAG: YegS/Rv2252/BmrU family lipid kinase [Acidobacteria bacterium]|nr:YegS/Rv2252/BmrU family lipid kinase [Acidobacteriota bacterium]